MTFRIGRAALPWFSIASACIFAGACQATNSASPTGGTQANASRAGGSNLPAGDDDLPCDVRAVLAAQCWSCHGATLHGGATVSLVSRSTLSAPSAADAAQTYAQRAVFRMKDAQAPMPPGKTSTVSSTDIATVQAWIDGGYQGSSCSDAGADPFNVPAQCTSGKQLGSNQEEGKDMNPGHACIACHAKHGDAPLFAFAGTVFPTAHEPDDCVASGSKGATVEVTDATGQVFTIEVGSAGNFFLKSGKGGDGDGDDDDDDDDGDGNKGGGSLAFAYPYTARVLYEGRERKMTAAQSDGDCNGCHTQNGTKDAPGRILLP